ncbi:MAG: hypothetical protein ABIH03_04330 [Pseudomonadota bacterium]
MAEEAHKVDFTIPSDYVVFTTMMNGDRLIFQGLHLDTEGAADMARLVNQPAGTILSVKIKVDN